MVNEADNSQTALRFQAAAGRFRAIALWLNQPLSSQGVFVQVTSERPGCLTLAVEFQRPPQKERLIRFLCHRIWQLNSPIIEGIHVVGRPMGGGRILWDHHVRVITPALKASWRRAAAAPSSSPLPPRLRVSQPPSGLLDKQLKTLRAFVLSGSTVAAFVLGCFVDLILTRPSSTLPSFAVDSRMRSPAAEEATLAQRSQESQLDSTLGRQRDATPVSYDTNFGQFSGQSSSRSLPRSPIVDAALEPVAVIPYSPQSLLPTADVTLLFGGDFSLEGLSEPVLSHEQVLLDGVSDYQQVDIALMNLGSSLAEAATTVSEDYYQQRRPDAAKLLKAGGIDIVNLSDDSIMAYGEAGLEETLNILDRTGIYRVGAGRNQHEARRPEILDVKGERIAYLSYAQGDEHSANGGVLYPAWKDNPGVNAQGILEISEDIRALRDEVDWIVVNYRWKAALSEHPADWQTNLARLAIDQGADLVVGYHPTQLQGGEIYKGRPIAYSLGDFVFKQHDIDARQSTEQALMTDQDTVVLKVSLRKEHMKVEFLPVQVRNARPQIATGKAAKVILEAMEQVSLGFDEPIQPKMQLHRRSRLASPDYSPNSDQPFVLPGASGDLSGQQSLPPASGTEAEPSDDLGGRRPSPQLDGWDGLNDWGPKTSPQEEFKPIPSAIPEEVDESIPDPIQPIRFERHLPQADPEKQLERKPPASQHPVSQHPAAEHAEFLQSIESFPYSDQVAAAPQPSPIEVLESPTSNSPSIAPYDEPLVGLISSVEATSEAIAQKLAYLDDSVVGLSSPIAQLSPAPASNAAKPALNQ